jgi:hypothetical protein
MIAPVVTSHRDHRGLRGRKEMLGENTGNFLKASLPYSSVNSVISVAKIEAAKQRHTQINKDIIKLTAGGRGTGSSERTGSSEV